MKQPSRKQTALSGFLLVLLIFGAYVVGFVGWGSPRASLMSQSSATDTCTIAIGQFQCTKAETFSPQFTNVPFVSVTNRYNSPGVLGTALGAYPFFTGPHTWTGMPAASTEIFGSANYEVSPQISSATTVFFSIDCILGSNNPGAQLSVDYDNGAGAWTSLMLISIDPSSNCATGYPFEFLTASAVITPTVFANGIYWRISGSGGGGVGDNPVFSQATLTFTRSVPIETFCGVAISPPLTISGFTVRCVQSVALSSTNLASFSWRAT